VPNSDLSNVREFSTRKKDSLGYPGIEIVLMSQPKSPLQRAAQLAGFTFTKYIFGVILAVIRWVHTDGGCVKLLFILRDGAVLTLLHDIGLLSSDAKEGDAYY